MKRLPITLIGISLMVMLLACCSNRKSNEAVGDIFDETNLSEGEKMIQKTMEEYDFKRMIVLCDSLEQTGDISPVTANFYHGGALIHRGMMKEALQYLEKATADRGEVRGSTQPGPAHTGHDGLSGQ
jgi:hypothetical protein